MFTNYCYVCVCIIYIIILINPCKPELGRVGKQIVENIVHEVKVRTQMKQWRNTGDVINWFSDIKDKTSQTMICFDICDFYPSISSSLLQKSLTFASQYTNITKEEIHIITHTKKKKKKNQPFTKMATLGQKNHLTLMSPWEASMAQKCAS